MTWVLGNAAVALHPCQVNLALKAKSMTMVMGPLTPTEFSLVICQLTPKDVSLASETARQKMGSVSLSVCPQNLDWTVFLRSPEIRI